MSSKSLPLIFDPSEDMTPEGAAAAAGFTPVPLPLSEVDMEQLVTGETDGDGPSHAPSLLIPEWMSPWQTSGAELQEPIGTVVPSVSQQHAGTEPDEPTERGESLYLLAVVVKLSTSCTTAEKIYPSTYHQHE